jgi:hypothetical protein
MSWLDRVMGRSTAKPVPQAPGVRAVVTGSGSYGVACVGESNYVPALLRAAGASRSSPGPLEAFVEVRLIREPQNPYDANAVAVQSVHGPTLAYLCREDAVEYGPEIERASREHRELRCSARIGGRRVDGANWRIGIWLDLPA